jgi:MFS family permease
MPGLKLLSDILGGAGGGRSVAFYTASFGVGTAISFFFVGEVDALVGWRWTFALTAAGPIIALLIAFLFVPRPATDPNTVPDTHLLDFRPVLRSRAAMGYVLAYTAHNFELFAFRSWIVAYLVFAEGLSGVTLVVGATVLAALFNLLGLPSSVIGNELAARFGRHRVITIIMLMSGAVACVLGFAATLPQWALLALCVVYGILIIGESASVTTGVVQAAPEGYRGATMAVHSCIGFSGSFAGPLVFGVVLDLAGGQSVTAWGLAFASAGIGAFLGPLALFLLRERKSV